MKASGGISLFSRSATAATAPAATAAATAPPARAHAIIKASKANAVKSSTPAGKLDTHESTESRTSAVGGGGGGGSGGRKTKPLRVPGFKELGVSERLVRTCQKMGLLKPTDIQMQCIPSILTGTNDLVGRAKTGSGKTAAFALPIIQRWGLDPYGVFAVVLTPTRELAYQIADQFRVFGVEMQLKDCVIIGGQDMLLEARELCNRPHVIIATPGRLAHHIDSHTVAVTLSPSSPHALANPKGPLVTGSGGGGGGSGGSGSGTLHFAHVKYLVLDEADRLLIDPSFKAPLQTILSVLPGPSDRQTLLFSATLPTNMNELVGSITKPTEQIITCQVSSDENAFVDTLDQRYLFIPEQVKEVYLVYILTETVEFKDTTCIIFTRTKERCEKIAGFLTEMGLSDIESLHSNKNQARRNASLGKFRAGQSKILVATDVAARGLDIPAVRLVINFDVPSLIPDYVHRVGRTARAGRAGVAITLCSAGDVSIFTQIEEYTGKRMIEYPLPEQKVLSLLKKVFTTKVVTEIRIDEYRKKLARNRYQPATKSAVSTAGAEDGDEGGGGADGDTDFKHSEDGKKRKATPSATSNKHAQPTHKASTGSAAAATAAAAVSAKAAPAIKKHKS